MRFFLPVLALALFACDASEPATLVQVEAAAKDSDPLRPAEEDSWEAEESWDETGDTAGDETGEETPSEDPPEVEETSEPKETEEPLVCVIDDLNTALAERNPELDDCFFACEVDFATSWPANDCTLAGCKERCKERYHLTRISDYVELDCAESKADYVSYMTCEAEEADDAASCLERQGLTGCPSPSSCQKASCV